MIAGSSIGALIGTFYAASCNVERLYKLAAVFKRKYYLDFTVPKMGFIAGKRIKDMIKMFTYNKNLEELDIPTAVVATDILKGRKLFLQVVRLRRRFELVYLYQGCLFQKK